MTTRHAIPPAPHLAPGSRQTIFLAAAAEFAARGFDGARVDRIARAAGLNKAMIYYHFRSKAGLYREVVLDLFTALADAFERIATSRLSAEAQIRAAIDTVAAEASARPHFPVIMPREIAEGGRHLDRVSLRAMGRVFQALAGIIETGVRSGEFRPVSPPLAYFSIIAPLIFFLASGPIRDRLLDELRRRGSPVTFPAGRPAEDLASMLDHHKIAIALMLAAPAALEASDARARRTNVKPRQARRARKPPAKPTGTAATTRTTRSGDHA